MRKLYGNKVGESYNFLFEGRFRPVPSVRRRYLRITHRARRTARPGLLGDSEEYDPDGQQAEDAPDDDHFPCLSGHCLPRVLSRSPPPDSPSGHLPGACPALLPPVSPILLVPPPVHGRNIIRGGPLRARPASLSPLVPLSPCRRRFPRLAALLHRSRRAAPPRRLGRCLLRRRLRALRPPGRLRLRFLRLAALLHRSRRAPPLRRFGRRLLRRRLRALRPPGRLRLRFLRLAALLERSRRAPSAAVRALPSPASAAGAPASRSPSAPLPSACRADRTLPAAPLCGGAGVAFSGGGCGRSGLPAAFGSASFGLPR